jgi:23S rRNA pseudouridine2605 synthase
VSAEETIRLQKYLSERGVCSRRHAAEFVHSGRVAVDGETILEPGFRVTPGRQRVAVDGRPVEAGRAAPQTIMLHKPRGVICSRSDAQGETVYDLDPPIPQALVPVGRLDKDSEGLLVMSSDGDLVQRLTHPRHGQRKTYRVTVLGTVTEDHLSVLRSQLVIDEYRIRPAEVTVADARRPGYTLLEIVLHEGRKRQIREMCRAARLHVVRLVRVSVGPLTLGRLRPGEWRELTGAELRAVER